LLWQDDDMQSFRNFINGQFVDAKNGETTDVINPATEELITQLPIDDGAAVAIKAQKARNAQAAWAATPLSDRMACIKAFRALVQTQLRRPCQNHDARNRQALGAFAQ